jgi:DNA-binding transcriptional MerR regulator
MFDLQELCDLAGVTPRTVRYYIQQGLLPSPGTRGPGARYEMEHLERLQLIRRLQKEHLPLSEIRHRLESIDADGVRLALNEPEPRRSSALDYVRSVLARQDEPGPAPPPTAGRPMRASAAMPQIVSMMVAEPSMAPESMRTAESISQPPVTRSQWERIALAPDVELHVRRPLSRGQNKLVERLTEVARRFFEEEA